MAQLRQLYLDMFKEAMLCKGLALQAPHSYCLQVFCLLTEAYLFFPMIYLNSFLIHLWVKLLSDIWKSVNVKGGGHNKIIWKILTRSVCFISLVRSGSKITGPQDVCDQKRVYLRQISRCHGCSIESVIGF